MVRRYWICQFQVILEAALIENVTELAPPVAGTLPVPVHPVVTYCTPALTGIGVVTDSVTEEVALNHPLAGVGVS